MLSIAQEIALVSIDHPEQYVRKLISTFQVPRHDALVECYLRVPDVQRPIWDSAIFVSTKQSEHFYSDIFHFWVRAFFFFVEDSLLGTMFQEMAPYIECKKISAEEFQRRYLMLLNQRVPEESFIEAQRFHDTYTELEKRSFSSAYVMLDRPNIKSSVANSDGEYVAYFQTVPEANH